MWLHAAEITYDCEKELESLDMNINLKNKLLAQCGLHFNLLCVGLTYETEMGIISTQLQLVDIQASVTFLQHTFDNFRRP